MIKLVPWSRHLVPIQVFVEQDVLPPRRVSFAMAVTEQIGWQKRMAPKVLRLGSIPPQF